tara:strand:+ start:450 stop:599 length:150 start_codon:yes stop_codon:yes gene_type:complete
MVESKDRGSLIKAIMYLIRDVLFYSELVEIKEFLKEIIIEKKREGYDDR